MKISCNKNKIQIKYASERREKLQEKEAKMTQNQIINEKTWQEKKKKIATSKNILTNTPKKKTIAQKPCYESK
jgi:hypothetical protein